ncbi:transmembrane domain near N [Cryptosporidium ryanae]|uniref:transmembrane domain near N n=1 Tax=Cryptosporidium ryanae TaxID=515981 RepID=UPI00351AA24B|nr:transmembrane domain near N [Cryptosporidium ryanae]
MTSMKKENGKNIDSLNENVSIENVPCNKNFKYNNKCNQYVIMKYINPVNILNLIFSLLFKVLVIIFNFFFKPRINKKLDMYPYYDTNEVNIEPRSKYGYRFFQVNNKFVRLGFGFEYNNVYYFSNSHFSTKSKIIIDKNEIKLYQIGFCFLSSNKIPSDLIQPHDGEDLFLVNPYTQTIKGKCIFKDPHYYSYFPISTGHRNFIGLPVLNSKGELVSTFDNLRIIDDVSYVLLGEKYIWTGNNALITKEMKYEKNCVIVTRVEYPKFELELFNIHNNNIDNIIGTFFKYKSVYYISSKFIDPDKNTINIDIEKQCGFADNLSEIKNKKFIKLFREWYFYSPNSKHNFNIPDEGVQVKVVNFENGDKYLTGVIKYEQQFRIWADFKKCPIKKLSGYPILDNNDRIIGIYGDFNTNIEKPSYSVLVGNNIIFKDCFFKMILSNNSKYNCIHQINYDSSTLDNILSNCKFKGETSHNSDTKHFKNVIFGLENENEANEIKNYILNKSGVKPNSVVTVDKKNINKSFNVSNSNSGDTRFLFSSTNWIVHYYIKNNNKFPFNDPNNLTIIFPSESSRITEELLIKYYEETSKKKRGYLMFIVNS